MAMSELYVLQLWCGTHAEQSFSAADGAIANVIYDEFSIMQILGTWCYAYCITQLVEQVANWHNADVRFKAHQDKLMEYMAARNLPISLQKRLLQFHDFQRKHAAVFYKFVALPLYGFCFFAKTLYGSLLKNVAPMTLMRGTNLQGDRTIG